jgi:uncharacterized protein (UPF0548 family)
LIVFLARRPSAARIEEFLNASRGLPLTYGPTGLATHGAPGYDLDEVCAVIGHGKAEFDRARAALARWAHVEGGWVEVFPRGAPVEPGTVVAVLIRHCGFWSLNASRVVYRFDGSDTRFGFAYGTLPTHAECGEESFEVALNTASGEVTYRLRAASRPRAALARIGYPIARTLQARFRRDSARAMGSDRGGLTPV